MSNFEMEKLLSCGSVKKHRITPQTRVRGFSCFWVFLFKWGTLVVGNPAVNNNLQTDYYISNSLNFSFQY